MGTIQLEIISDQTQKCSEKNRFGSENVWRLNASLHENKSAQVRNIYMQNKQIPSMGLHKFPCDSHVNPMMGKQFWACIYSNLNEFISI